MAAPGSWPGRGKSGLPEATVPGNARAGQPDGQRHREQTAPGAPGVRVKRWGKSPPRDGQPDRHGKPHREQCRIGAPRGRVRRAASTQGPGLAARSRRRRRDQRNGHPGVRAPDRIRLTGHPRKECHKHVTKACQLLHELVHTRCNGGKNANPETTCHHRRMRHFGRAGHGRPADRCAGRQDACQ
jgi:hypothetical protein